MKLITTPNLVQTTNGFKRVEDVVVGDKVLSMGTWKEVTEPPQQKKCYKINLSAGFPIIVERTALTDCKQKAFITSKFRKFSSNYNSGFYCIPYLADCGFLRIPKGDSRLYKSIICLTRDVKTPNGQIGYLKPIRVNTDDFSLLSCIDVLESLVNRGMVISKKGDVLFRHMGEFGALVMSLLRIDIFSEDKFTLVAPYSLYRMFDMLRNVDVDIPNYVFEKAIRYNNSDGNRYFTTLSKEKVTDWCLSGVRPDINGVSMAMPSERNYWSRLVNGKRKRKQTKSKTDSTDSSD